MTKPASTNKKPRKEHTSELRNEDLKLAECIGAAPLHGNSDCTNRSSTHGVVRLILPAALPNVSRKCPLKLPVLSANWRNRQRS